QPSHKATAGQATSAAAEPARPAVTPYQRATAWQTLPMTKGVNHEAHEGARSFCSRTSGVILW
ncbi:MAG TPA: hypothetical protein VGQ43_00655, partial [Candidatus Udaeobacter sp.]|nr:hypothetical protein [Candidatus Udaeobacter sp.]